MEGLLDDGPTGPAVVPLEVAELQSVGEAVAVKVRVAVLCTVVEGLLELSGV